MSLKEQIEKYTPYDEQEQRDKEQMLKFINDYADVLTRDNIFAHFSASAFVVNKDRTKMVVVYHIINDGWIQPGGHSLGEEQGTPAASADGGSGRVLSYVPYAHLLQGVARQHARQQDGGDDTHRTGARRIQEPRPYYGQGIRVHEES